MKSLEGLKQSRAYRWRLPVTTARVLAARGASIFVPVVVLETSKIDRWLDCLGWLMLALGNGLRAWVNREISGRKRLCVVDCGPYALCRNPLYLGAYLFALSQF